MGHSTEEIDTINPSTAPTQPVNSHTNTAQYLSPASEVSRPVTPPSAEIFTLAPEAFKSDGTPVTDRQEAKMFDPKAKRKRAMFRRQSTITSLGSICLGDDDLQEDVEGQERERGTFRDFFYSCDEGDGQTL